MGIFNKLDDTGLEQTEDRLGGYSPFSTDIYHSKIKLAYAIESSGGAAGVVFVADINGREYRETLWVTNKKGETFYLNKNDKTKKVPLPGFEVVNTICIMTTEKPLKEQATEEKMVNIYDYDLRKEVPKSVQVLVDLLGKDVYLAITENLVNKTEKRGDEFVPIADTRIENSIEKVFHYPTKMTINEATSEKPEATFFDAWSERNSGNQRDRRSIKDGGSGGTAGAPQAGASGSKPKSLFG